MKGKTIVQNTVKYVAVSFGFYMAGTGMANAACPAGSTIINNLPAYITSSGTYCLNSHKNIASQGAIAVSISASNVTLDFDRWEIRGPGAFSDAVSGYGVTVTNNAQNVTIRNGALIGFHSGIISVTNSGSNHTDGLLVDNMSIRSMGYAGVQVGLNSYCDNCTVQNSDISNVDANRVTTQGGYSGAYGIRFERSNYVSIKNNVITGVHSRGTLPSAGIYMYRGQNAVVEGNSVADAANSLTDDTGILFVSHPNGTALDNHISYFYRGIWFAYSTGGGYAGNTFYSVVRPVTGGTEL